MKWCKVIICVLFYMLSAKHYYFSLFLPYLLFLIKFKIAAKMATMFGDATVFQEGPHP